MLASLREFFLLRRAEERARALGEIRRPGIHALQGAIRRRARAAESLPADDSVAALVLYRDALPLAARVLLANLDLSDEDALSALGRKLDALPEPRKKPLQRALVALSQTEGRAFDAIEPKNLPSLRQDVADLFAWLESRDEPRTVTQLRVIRALRIAGAALAILLLGRLAIGAFLAPPNRALRKPVVASSRYPDTPDPSGFTDGDRVTLGVHTNNEPTPLVSVDLGVPYKVDRVRIYQRTDCCPDDSLPLVVEVGDDGDPAPFVAERTTHFDVWEIDVGGHSASTVKVRTTRNPGYIALAELEVFGRR